MNRKRRAYTTTATAALLFGAFGLSLIGCGDDEQTYTGHVVVGYVTGADTGKPIPWRPIHFWCGSHWGGWIHIGYTKTNAEGDYVFLDPAYTGGETLDTVLSHVGHDVYVECEQGGGYKFQSKLIHGFGPHFPERVDFQLDPFPPRIVGAQIFAPLGFRAAFLGRVKALF